MESASPQRATIHSVRNHLQSVVMGASVLKQQLVKLEAAPESIQSAALSEKKPQPSGRRDRGDGT